MIIKVSLLCENNSLGVLEMKEHPERIGILGGGQLGLMLCKALQQLGVKVSVYDPTPDCPCASVADYFAEGSFSDHQAILGFASDIEILTFEFENISSETLIAIEKIKKIHPSPAVLYISQDRIREKGYLNSIDIPTAKWREINTLSDLTSGVDALGVPSILKTSSMGYDGRGQIRLSSSEPAYLKECLDRFEGRAAVLEQWVPFIQEFSLIGARDSRGNMSFWDPFVNHHENHILESTLYPGFIPPKSAELALSMGKKIMESMNVVGLLTIEFFLLPDGRVLVNELAPRPHNSGHITIEASETSQFYQLALILTGRPLGSVGVIKPGAMINLLGDLWLGSKGEPDWNTASGIPGVFLHLYGKKTPKNGRKMGHLTFLHQDPCEALVALRTLKQRLSN